MPETLIIRLMRRRYMGCAGSCLFLYLCRGCRFDERFGPI
jgi:hypothetical protein